MLFPLIITLTLSLTSPAFAFEDLNDFMAGHRAEQDRAHEQRQQAQRQAEETANYYQQQRDLERLNAPTRYESPSYVNPTPSFNFYDGATGQTKVCTSYSGGVSCF